MQFMDSGLDSMEFGGKKIPLTILTSEDIGEWHDYILNLLSHVLHGVKTSTERINILSPLF